MVLFLPSIRICSYSVPVFLLSIGFLTFLPIHLGKKRRSWWNRIGVCIPSLLAHCLMTGVVVCLAQMWFIKAVAFTPMMHPMTTTTTTTDTSSSSAPPLLSQAASSTESSSLSELPSFIIRHLIEKCVFFCLSDLAAIFCWFRCYMLTWFHGCIY